MTKLGDLFNSKLIFVTDYHLKKRFIVLFTHIFVLKQAKVREKMIECLHLSFSLWIKYAGMF